MHLHFYELEITSFLNTSLQPLNTGLSLSYFITAWLNDVEWEYNCGFGGRKDVGASVHGTHTFKIFLYMPSN
jgi:hypothetical protein